MPSGGTANSLVPRLGVFEEVGPVMHHLGAGFQVERVVVGCAYSISGNVCELQFDVLMSAFLFVQDRGSQPPEAQWDGGLKL